MPLHYPTDTSLKGGLLFSAPHVSDGPFYKSVILLTDHSREHGAEGYVLNHPTERQVIEISSDTAIPPDLHHVDVFYGGPVEINHLSFGTFAMIDERLFYRMAINAKEATQHMQEHGTLVRAFVGKASWEPGQLELELDNFTWFFAPISDAFMSFPHDVTLWKNLLCSLSPMHDLLTRAPKHPFLN